MGSFLQYRISEMCTWFPPLDTDYYLLIFAPPFTTSRPRSVCRLRRVIRRTCLAAARDGRMSRNKNWLEDSSSLRASCPSMTVVSAESIWSKFLLVTQTIGIDFAASLQRS
jgi:hypothetical protein